MGRAHRLPRSLFFWLCLSFLMVLISLRNGLTDYQQLPVVDTFPLTLETSRTINNANKSEPVNPLQDDAKPTRHFVNETVPYDRTQIVKPIGAISISQCTIVTSYFNVPSKFEPKYYLKWMRNMLSLQDAMVIFTSPEYVETVQGFRSHATNRTVIFPMRLEHTPIATMFTTRFWERQLQKDVEKDDHKSYELFWIWLSKSWFTTQAIEHNFFQSSIFLWSDIGTFRGSPYNKRILIQHPELVPRHAILQMAHDHPTPSKRMFEDRKTRNFYHSGSHAIGYADTWLIFYSRFLETIQGFVDRHLFLGDDQVVLQSTCRQHPTLCAYVNHSEVSDGSYFGLRYVLRFGGNYTYWYPPPLTSAEKEQLRDPSGLVSILLDVRDALLELLSW